QRKMGVTAVDMPLVKIGKAAELLGVSVQMLRNGRTQRRGGRHQVDANPGRSRRRSDRINAGNSIQGNASLRRVAEKAKRTKMLLAHKIALDPNAEQRLYFVRAAGTARFAWNWALAEWKRQYKAGERPTEVSLRRQLNAIKREQFPWMYDVTKAAAQEAIIDLGSAFLAFFEKRGRYPRFKRKDYRASFCAANEVGTFRTNGKRIKLPVIGWVKMREAVRFTGPLKRASVSCEAGRWFGGFQIKTDDVKPVTQPEAEVGIDLGVSALATLSTGEIIVGPKSHAVALKQLRRASRAFSHGCSGALLTSGAMPRIS